MACKHTGARGIILGLVYVLAMIFVAPLRLTDAYEAVTLLLPGTEGTLPLLALGAAGAIPVGAFLAALPRRIHNRRQGVHVARSTARECLYGFAGGFVLLLGAGMAGGGIAFHVFGGAASGALSGFAAAALLLLAACGAARLCGARKEGTGQ